MNKTMTMILTVTALSIAIPAAALEGCEPYLTRSQDGTVEVDSGRELYDATGGDDCTTGLAETGCDVSETTKENVFGFSDPDFRRGLRVYVDSDPCQPVVGTGTCTFSIWAYMETNGIDGLQRHDPGVPGDVSADDTCDGMIPPDHVFF